MRKYLKARGKAVAEAVLLLAARRAFRKQARSAAAVILAYHNVLPPATPRLGDPSLHLSLDDFRLQLDRLTRTHQVVPLRELPRRGAPGHAPRAAITFDDAYRGCLKLAVPELVSRALPATIFVPPALLGRPAFWWDVQAAGEEMDAALRRRGIERNEHPIDRSGAPSHPDVRPGTLEELRQAVALPGIEVASHGWSHGDLRGFGDADLREELDRSRRWLEQHFPRRHLSEHVSFPYGLWDGRVVRVAAEMGYRYLYKVDGGVASEFGEAAHPAASSAAGSTATVLPRVNVPADVSARGFELRLAGIMK